jgi:putative SOS response-associated peptidase YedK
MGRLRVRREPNQRHVWALTPLSRCSLPDDRGKVHITPWQAGPGGKTPYYLQLKDGSPFAFAGLWERWEKGEEPVESCTLITTEANGVVGPVHHRMPVMLDPSSFERWLDPNEQRAEALKVMLVPLPDEWMTAHAVSKLVNNPRNEGPRCVEPAGSG